MEKDKKGLKVESTCSYARELKTKFKKIWVDLFVGFPDGQMDLVDFGDYPANKVQFGSAFCLLSAAI
jgi:hypothetical protein